MGDPLKPLSSFSQVNSDYGSSNNKNSSKSTTGSTNAPLVPPVEYVRNATGEKIVALKFRCAYGKYLCECQLDANGVTLHRIQKGEVTNRLIAKLNMEDIFGAQYFPLRAKYVNVLLLLENKQALTHYRSVERIYQLLFPNESQSNDFVGALRSLLAGAAFNVVPRSRCYVFLIENLRGNRPLQAGTIFDEIVYPMMCAADYIQSKITWLTTRNEIWQILYHLDCSELNGVVFICNDDTISTGLDGFLSRPDYNELLQGGFEFGFIPVESQCRVASSLVSSHPADALFQFIKGLPFNVMFSSIFNGDFIPSGVKRALKRDSGLSFKVVTLPSSTFATPIVFYSEEALPGANDQPDKWKVISQ